MRAVGHRLQQRVFIVFVFSLESKSLLLWCKDTEKRGKNIKNWGGFEKKSKKVMVIST